LETLSKTTATLSRFLSSADVPFSLLDLHTLPENALVIGDLV